MLFYQQGLLQSRYEQKEATPPLLPEQLEAGARREDAMGRRDKREQAV